MYLIMIHYSENIKIGIFFYHNYVFKFTNKKLYFEFLIYIVKIKNIQYNLTK